ncbi:TPA: hypothetical protein M4R09_001762 [Salmonella enterica subsp. enterica serovar Paratyphi C]|uniref:Uncharacterized protein n=1 Tax=Salmonella enterica TaxID=28901 RepID=A0A5C2M6P7_SALER|nr:hypothetical protein [Salmonella enterica]EAW5231989.1 hypothetical protein [Salmonella enterica subsp. enterica serovar Paratyphi C]EBJ3427814.1 hypothetical protein [Salmonella enterica]ECD0134728.1 hypothetical protein [Salmonella enterica subsp. enterica serovar Paratyphi C]ECD0895844.1 hypothetical protein [Salmonella enterica subsp. enterica serovar Paratyphi C]ECE6818603.1 hypothetical protein [Salmonella enterica subsp. enterica serovar Paratyphi C]
MGISLPGTAAMVEFGGDYTYRGTITVTGEALIGPVVDVRVPKAGVTLCSPTRVTVEQCNARLEHKNQDGSWNVVTGMQCIGQGSNYLSVVTPISKIYKLVYGDFYRVVFDDVRGRFEPSGAVEHSSRCMIDKNSITWGNPVSGGVLELSTSSGQTERLAIYGQPETTFLMPVTAVDKTYIEYPAMTRLSVAPDGSVRGQVVTVVGRNAQVKFTLREAYGNNNLNQYWIPTAASGNKIKPQLIKKDGSQCVNAREGESCDLYYPPGSVPPGRYYRGYVDIYATVY